MMIATRILIIPAFVWAVLPPGTYSLFALVGHWSALVDLMVVASCLVLAISAFKRLKDLAWFGAFVFMVCISISGVIHHLQESGESGPLPFEWMNGYYLHSVPLLVAALISRVTQKSQKSQQAMAHRPA